MFIKKFSRHLFDLHHSPSSRFRFTIPIIAILVYLITFNVFIIRTALKIIQIEQTLSPVDPHRRQAITQQNSLLYRYINRLHSLHLALILITTALTGPIGGIIVTLSCLLIYRLPDLLT